MTRWSRLQSTSTAESPSRGSLWDRGTEQLSTLQIPNLEISQSLGWPCSGKWLPSWISTIRLPCDCTMIRCPGIPEGRSPEGRTSGAYKSLDCRGAGRHTFLPETLQPISLQANTSCAFSSTTLETLKPTVELGVWEPEKVLARLRLDGAE